MVACPRFTLENNIPVDYLSCQIAPSRPRIPLRQKPLAIMAFSPCTLMNKRGATHGDDGVSRLRINPKCYFPEQKSALRGAFVPRSFNEREFVKRDHTQLPPNLLVACCAS